MATPENRTPAPEIDNPPAPDQVTPDQVPDAETQERTFLDNEPVRIPAGEATSNPDQHEESTSIFRGLEKAVVAIRLIRARQVIKKLETKEKVSSSTARKSLENHAAEEAPTSAYDKPEHYMRPVNPLERFLARHRRERARRMGRRAYRSQELVEIYGEGIKGDIPSRKERLANGERVTGKEHRRQVKASVKHHKLAEASVNSAESKRESLQRIVDRDTFMGGVRKLRIEYAKKKKAELEANLADEHELHIPQIRSLDLSDAIQRKVERLGPGKFGESAPDNPDDDSNGNGGGNQPQNSPRRPRNPSSPTSQLEQDLAEQNLARTQQDLDPSQVALEQVMAAVQDNERQQAALQARLESAETERARLRAILEGRAGQTDTEPANNNGGPQTEPDDSEPSQDVMYGGHKITLPFGEYVRFPGASDDVENDWVLTGYKASTDKVTLSKYPENPENHETKEVSIEEYADFNRLLRPKKRPSIFSYFT